MEQNLLVDPSQDEENILTKLAKYSAENIQKQKDLQKDYINIQKDRVNMAINPELQGPRLEEGLFAEPLPSEKEFFKQNISPALQIGSISNKKLDLKPGDSFFDKVRQKAIEEGKDIGKTLKERRDQAYKLAEEEGKRLEILKKLYSPEELSQMTGKIKEVLLNYLKERGY